MTKEEKAKYNKQWKKDNKEQVKQYNTQWRKDNPEYNKQYYKDHKEELNKKNKQWTKDHLEYRKEHRRQYYTTQNGKEIIKRHCAKRKRNLGYIPLNKWFKGSVGHHINCKYVIYIPKKLHQSIYHKLGDWDNMLKINKLAFQHLIDNG